MIAPILSLALALRVANGLCPPDYQPYAGDCYRLHADKWLSFWKAEEECNRTPNSHLAGFTNRAEFLFIAGLVNDTHDHEQVYLGYYHNGAKIQSGPQGRFKLDSVGHHQPPDFGTDDDTYYTYWNGDEPDREWKGGCVLISGAADRSHKHFHLDDGDCDYKKQFLCGVANRG